MSDKTKIEWTDATWNPVTGCTQVSPGCDHCYALTFAERFRGTPGHYFENGFDVQMRPERLDQPLRWKRPRRIFVNSMSDLFHADVPDKYIAQAFAVMALAQQHTFQVLTKRHARMRALLNSPDFMDTVYEFFRAGRPRRGPLDELDRLPWPLPNVWLGVSVEDQQWANIRVPILLGTPATVRFLSCEPLLGPVDLRRAIEPNFARGGWRDLSRLHWVIAGGESGRGARPMHPDWARSLRDQCTSAGIAFHFKQWGEWVTEEQAPEDITLPGISWRHLGDHQPSVYKVGKKAAGRELDGRTWDEMPRAKS